MKGGSMAVDLSNPNTLKQAQKMLWSLGDYREVARMLEPEADALVEACGTFEGKRVLDVAAGSGNFAVAAARRGATVIASDFSPQMIAWGQERCQAESLRVEWREADAEDLPFEEGSFDCCASMFGAMFALRPMVVARELFRVTRSGGLVAMANWTQEGFCGRLAALISGYAPPAPVGMPSPFDWGEPDVVRTLFERKAASLAMDRHCAAFTFGSVPEGQAFFEKNNAPMVAIRARLPPERYEALAGEVAALLQEFNRGGAGQVAVEAEYLRILAHKAE
jgi:SAM-dependent methyltransferase